MSTAPAGTDVRDAPRARHRWSLQTRLIVTVVSFVALILVGIGFATGKIGRAHV